MMKAGYFRKNNNGAMVIHYAAQGGQINFAKWLVDDRKQAISTKNEYGARAIHYAAQGGQINFAKWLVDDRKQNIALKSERGMAIHVAAVKWQAKFVMWCASQQLTRKGDWGRFVSLGDWARLVSAAFSQSKSLAHRIAGLYYSKNCSCDAMRNLNFSISHQKAVKSRTLVKERANIHASGSGPSTSSPERKKRKPNNHSGLDALAYVASKKSAKK